MNTKTNSVFTEEQKAEIERLIEKKLDERAKNFVEKFAKFKPSDKESFLELREIIADSKPTQH